MYASKYTSREHEQRFQILFQRAVWRAYKAEEYGWVFVKDIIKFFKDNEGANMYKIFMSEAAQRGYGFDFKDAHDRALLLVMFQIWDDLYDDEL